MIERYSQEHSRNGFAPFGTLSNITRNGGKGSGNFGHEGREGKVGGSAPSRSGGSSAGKKSKESRIRDAIEKSIASQKKLQDRAKVVREDIEDRIGQKMKEGEEYTVLDEAHKSRFKVFHGEDGTEYTYDKENGMITKTNPKTGDEEVVTKQEKDQTSSSEKKSEKGRIDPDDTGVYSLMIAKDGDSHKVKSMGDESATRMLLGIDSTLQDVAKLPYDKGVKKEADAGGLSKAQTMVGQAIAGIGSILRMQAGEMGDAMTFVDKAFDYDNFDTQMQRVDEFLFNARKSLIGDSSKVGKKLSKALDDLERTKTNLQGIADPDLIKAKKEPTWIDIEDMMK